MKKATEEIQEDNVLPFRVIPGGKEPPSKSWLRNLDLGSVFLTKLANQKFTVAYNQFLLLHLMDEAACVVESIIEGPNDRSLTYWVNPDNFSTKFELVKVLRVVPLFNNNIVAEETTDVNE